MPSEQIPRVFLVFSVKNTKYHRFCAFQKDLHLFVHKMFAKTAKSVYDNGAMSFKTKIKKSRFVLSCIFLCGYALYTVYAVYYYRTIGNALSIVLLCLIAVALALSIFVTIVSYRINLMDKPRPALLRFVKMTKYAAQLTCSLVSLGFVLSAVQNFNPFSLIMAVISIPFLIWSIFVNVLAEYFERKFARGFGKKTYISDLPKDPDGIPVDLSRTIAQYDGIGKIKKMQKQAEKRNHRREN